MNRAMIWPCAVVGLLGMNAAIVGVTVYLAASNTTMVPEPRYYERAVRFDELAAQRAASARLGWTATASFSPGERGVPRLTARLLDREGRPVRDAVVLVDAIPNLRPAARSPIELRPTPDGEYAGDTTSTQPGLWTLRLEAHRGADVFTTELSAMMPGHADGGRGMP